MDTLLIVDDEPSILEAYAHYLGPAEETKIQSARLPRARQVTRSPYRLLLASSCEQAVELFDQELRHDRRIALGIFDMQMPGCDGFTLLRQLRQRDPELMCLVVTAHQDRPVDEIARYFEDNQDEWAYLAKPFHAAEIRQEVRNLVAAWHRRRARSQELEETNAALKLRTEELSAALENARAAASAKSEFLAMMSHELRTPMNGIVGMTQALERSQLTEAQRADLGIIRECGRMMALLLNDILDFSKIEAGKLEFSNEPFDLRREVTQVLAVFRRDCDDRGLALRMHLDEAVPASLVGDPARVRQVVSNVVSNAVKFTHRGSVDVRCRLEALEGSTARVAFEVQDTGIGIPPSRQAALFKPFSQADSSITRRFGGSGLGLAICKRLLAAMDGDIHIESVEGQGSICSFSFQLPLANSTRYATPSPISAMAHPHLRVLIVEDNRINRLVAWRLLETCGVQADLASDGKEALEAVRSKAFDLILMDMQMPEMDGLEATRRIRQLPLEAQPFIVALTANAFESDRRACLTVGMNSFLAKPVQLDALKGVLATVTCKLRPH